MKTPTWGAVAAFCAEDNWKPDRQSKHTFFEKALPNGTNLQTHVPHRKAGETIGLDLFGFILRTQLQVSAKEFWETIESKQPAKRPGHPTARPAARKPDARTVQRLHSELGLTGDEVAQLSRDQALRLLEKHWSRPR